MSGTDDLTIIGGGFSGLAAAAAAEAAGLSWRLIEARGRVGGRAKTIQLAGARVDVGPAWLWPGNRKALGLARRAGLSVFEQHATGRMVFEDRAGAVRRDLEMAPMAGSLRVDGGLQALAEALSASLPAHRITLGRAVASLRIDGRAVEAVDGSGDVLARARTTIAALPPRIAAQLVLSPEAPEDIGAALRSDPTWMAAQAKLIAVYDAPFWRSAGLSGDAISHRGPLAEVHDASPADAARGALFGFVGVPAAARDGAEDALQAAATAQLERLFGPEAAEPQALSLEDWAKAPRTTTRDDLAEPPRHPTGGAPTMTGAWSGRLFFAGAEHAPHDAGLVEGALAAGEAAAAAALDGLAREP